MNYKIAICDDEKNQLNYLSTLVSKWAKHTGHGIKILIYECAESFLFEYEDNKDINILLLDIEMGVMNGVELARKIREDNDSMQIVFITGFSHFISEGYEVSALHYLMKPVSEEKLLNVLNKAIKNLRIVEPTLLIDMDGEMRLLKLSDIMAVEAFSHYIKIYLSEEILEAKLSISEIEKVLDHSFVRCHRSYLVGLQHINRISKTGVVLDDVRVIPLSRRLYHDVNQAFIAYYKGEQ